MFKIIGLTAALSLASIGSAMAQMPVPNHDPAKVMGGTFNVEPMHTIVGFSIDHMGFSTYDGRFSGVSGTLVLDAKTPSKSSLEIHIPVASVSTPSTVLDGELKSADWLDATKYSEMVFKSTKIAAMSGGDAKVTGMLTLHGVTKPVTLKVKFHGSGINMMTKGYTVGFDATGVLKRGDFGVTKYLPLLGDDVTVTIAAAFQK